MRIFPVLVLVLFCPVFGQDLGNPDIVPFSLTGNLITAAENYSMPGLQTQRPVNTARLYFNPTLTLYDVQLPFSPVNDVMSTASMADGPSAAVLTPKPSCSR